MIPLHLYISGFLSYQEPVELDFSGFHMACISGPNGAGKSSLLDAFTWVLFGIARRRDDTLINSHSSTAEVILDLYYEGAEYRVQRMKTINKTARLEFFMRDKDGNWKPHTESTLRDTELKIQNTLHLDYDTFINASFFLQGKADLFAQQRPGDRKRILGNILGLEIWDMYQQIATERRKNLENELVLLNNKLAEIEHEMSEGNERRARLKQVEENLAQAEAIRKAKDTALEHLRRLSASIAEQQRLVRLLHSQFEGSQQREVAITSQLENRQREFDQYQERLANAEQISLSYQEWQDTRLQISRWDELQRNFHQLDSERSSLMMQIEIERTKLEKDRQLLLEHQLQIGSFKDTLSAADIRIKELLQAILDDQTRLQKRSSLETEINLVRETITRCKSENERLKNDMNKIKERVDRLFKIDSPTCPLCEQPLTDEHRQSMIEDLTTEGKQLGDAHRLNKETIRQGEENIQAIESDLENLRNIEINLQKLQRDLGQAELSHENASQEIQSWQTQEAPKLQEIERRLAQQDYAYEAQSTLEKIIAKLLALGYDPSAHEAARQSEKKGRTSEQLMRELEKARASMGQLEREIGNLAEQRTKAAAETASMEIQYQQAKEKYDHEAAALPDLDSAERELLLLREQENRLRTQVGGALQAVEVLKGHVARRAGLTSQKDEISWKITRYKLLEKAFGKDGIPALLIEQALPEIEEQANRILDRLTNGGMSVRFATQKEYKDKNREDKKETLDILISDGAGVREYELFSGGEAFRVNFAIRLALSRVLARRAGARLQTLVIDEGFGSQDSEGRQRLLEAINLVSSDFAKILVITHLEELKDAFPARIEVEKTERGSHVRVIA